MLVGVAAIGLAGAGGPLRVGAGLGAAHPGRAVRLGQPGCLTSSSWYYGVDGNHGAAIDLVLLDLFLGDTDGHDWLLVGGRVRASARGDPVHQRIPGCTSVARA